MIMRTRDGDGADRRLGAVAGKKTFPRAVDRSRAKRQIREAFRKVRHRLDDKVDYVLIARRRILEAGPGEIQGDFEKLASRKGLLKTAAETE